MKVINPHSSTTFRYSLITFLIVLVVFLGGIFYVKPLWDEVGKFAQTHEQIQGEKNALAKQFEELTKIQKTFNQSTEVSKQIGSNAIPERFDEDQLIMKWTEMAQKNDIVLNSISFGVAGAGSQTEKIKRADINANITGSLGNFSGFLKSLEGSERKMLVKSITVQTGQADTGTPRANFNISAETYYRDRL